jgi:hypothetical protein
MKKLISLFLLSVLVSMQSYAFCGFYVAKADATLFNNKSEVILVRDGRRTVITMSNDFKGDVRDFAMVVPVPVVLKESDIRVTKRTVFEMLDSYSAPRLVEYYDNNPCQEMYLYESDEITATSTSFAMAKSELFTVQGNSNVKIEARYQIGEYDILILSAKESNGLKDWLIANGYKIPETAAEVLQPYIKSNMKFFVVKVNLDKLKGGSFDYLSPIQLEFEHDKFMLPIRLGMANSTGSQDMIVYAFTRQGRVECTNYRTMKMPTDRKIPLFVKSQFGEFYKNLFAKNYKQEGKNAVFLEYAWNVTPNWGMKCDPCVGPPPLQQEFADAGVWWANDGSGSQTFFTRLHVRYEKAKFPSDLTFQLTPNNEHYQARYVLTNPATGEFDCEAGQEYLVSLSERRKLEVDELYALTGKTDAKSANYIKEYNKFKKVTEKKNSLPFLLFDWWKKHGGKLMISLTLISLSIVAMRLKPKTNLALQTNN